MYFKQIYDRKLAQFSYLIGCQATGEAVVVDPLRDIDQYYRAAENENLTITASVDTHIHADYISGLKEFADRGVLVYASDEGDEEWKYEWLLNSNYNYKLLKDGDTFYIGNIRFDILHTPGHTPESISIFVTDTVAADEPMGILSGDFVFVGDIGRPDLLETAAGQTNTMKPAAKTLYYSLKKFKELPEFLQIWPAHGSGSACGKALGAVPESTVGYELRYNPGFKASDSEQHFIDYILEGQPEPPLYFGRMKKVNKHGPNLLKENQPPKYMDIDEIVDKRGVIIDTRDSISFMDGHLPGSILAPFDRQFNTVAGSYIDENSDIYLIIERNNLKEAIIDLQRVGLDNVKGYAIPPDLKNWSGPLKTIKVIDFDEVKLQLSAGNRFILDVRKAIEYEEGNVPGALNIAHTRLAERVNELPREKTITVYCGSGQRASYAAGLLSKKGFNVELVNDLFDNWKQLSNTLNLK